MVNYQARVIARIWKKVNENIVIKYRIDAANERVDLLVKYYGVRYSYSCNNRIHLMVYEKDGGIIIDEDYVDVIAAMKSSAEQLYSGDDKQRLVEILNDYKQNPDYYLQKTHPHQEKRKQRKSRLWAKWEEHKKRKNAKKTNKTERIKEAATKTDSVICKKEDDAAIEKTCKNCVNFGDCFTQSDKEACERFHYNGGRTGDGFIVIQRLQGPY